MSTPRYLGTTVADAKAYVSGAITPAVFLQVFDLDRDGAVTGDDETAFASAVERAETEVDEILGASHGAPFGFAALPSSTQAAIQQCAAELLPWQAVKFRPTMRDEARAPFRTLYKDARERLARLATDNLRRLPSAAAPQPLIAAGIVDTSASAVVFSVPGAKSPF